MELNQLNQEVDQGQVIYTGNSIPGIPQGTPISVLDFISKLVEGYSSASRTTQISADDIVVTLGDATASLCIGGISFPNVSLSTTISGNYPSLSWDFSDLESSLSEDYTLSGVRVIITSSDPTKSRLIDSAAISGGLPIQLQDYPLSVVMEALVSSPCGILQGRVTRTITNPTEKGSFVVPLSFATMDSGVSERTLSGVISDMEAGIASVRQELLVGGQLRTLREAILYLADKIENM